MAIKGRFIESERMSRSSGNFNKPGCLRWGGVPVQFSTDAKGELWAFKLDAYEIIDMLDNPVKCPKHRKFQKEETEICSNKNGKIFRIIICEDYCRDVEEDCWCVIHVKPT